MRSLKEFGERFRRTAAARKYHHARRGGLVEHTAQMMRVAMAIAPSLSAIECRSSDRRNSFSRFAGSFGKIHCPENGFVMDYDERGELVGHISIGLELVNSLWRKVSRRKRRTMEKLDARRRKMFVCICCI